MIARSKTLVLFSVVAGFAFSACTVSFNNDLISSHSDEIEAYTADVFDEFYEKNTDEILRKAPKKAGFTSDVMEAVYEFTSVTAVPEEAQAVNRSFRRQNTAKYYITVFHVPRENGREVVTITVTTKDETCCELFGLHLNQQIGAQYVMNTNDVEEK